MIDFEQKRFDLLEKRFTNELEYLQEDAALIEISDSGDSDSEKGECNWILERIKHLELIIKNLHDISEDQDEEEKEKAEKEKENWANRDGLNNMLNEVEKYMYKKEWPKLAVSHKITKVKEYIEEKYNDETIGKKGKNIRRKLVKDLSKHITNNKLRTAKYVTYDPKEEKIISILALVYDYDQNAYEINI